MYPRKPQVANWETPVESLFDELKIVKVTDDTGTHFVKEKDFRKFVNQQIDD